MNHISKRLKNLGLLVLALALIISPQIQAQQKNDEEYTKKIKEYTSEKFFLTELVDHLPASDSVPTPAQVLGNVIGAPNILHDTSQIETYMKALGEATPRANTFSLGGTDEGKNMISVVISSEKNIQNLDRIKEIMALLADPRQVKKAEEKALLAEGLPIYWVTGGLHSTECGAPEMLMEMAYRLVVDESEFYQTIRDNLVVLITPTLAL
ncbi:MAG: hypothetical protein GQ544_01120, partial [Candidatus Aminicenantes bacterium]|nr:hypothetical protein [Candidatus Aminicenantes bacterium]